MLLNYLSSPAYGNLRSNAWLIRIDSFKNEVLASLTVISSLGIIPSNLDRSPICAIIPRFKSSIFCSGSIISLLFELYHIGKGVLMIKAKSINQKGTFFFPPSHPLKFRGLRPQSLFLMGFALAPPKDWERSSRRKVQCEQQVLGNNLNPSFLFRRKALIAFLNDLR